MAGKWYLIGIATNAQWFVSHRATMKMGTAMIIPTADGDLEMSYSSLRWVGEDREWTLNYSKKQINDRTWQGSCFCDLFAALMAHAGEWTTWPKKRRCQESSHTQVSVSTPTHTGTARQASIFISAFIIWYPFFFFCCIRLGLFEWLACGWCEVWRVRSDSLHQNKGERNLCC